MQETETFAKSFKPTQHSFYGRWDYPTFGSVICELSYRYVSAGDTAGYRYDFNGKETDAESKLQDYGMRIYNPSLAKFLSVDPISREYPWYSSYQFAGNKPIVAIDLDGLEEYIIHQRSFAPWEYFGNVWGGALNSDEASIFGFYTFAGDLRGFSLGTYASSRLRTVTTVNLTNNTILITKKICDFTYMFDADNKELLDQKRGSINYTAAISVNGTLTEASTFMSAAMPFLINLASKPIEWGSNFTIDNQVTSQGYIKVTQFLYGKGFPAYESIIEDPKGTKVFLSTFISPNSTQVATALSENHTYSQRMTNEFIIDTDCQGNFVGTVRYRYQNTDGSWSEWNNMTIDEWNNAVINSCPANDSNYCK